MALSLRWLAALILLATGLAGVVTGRREWPRFAGTPVQPSVCPMVSPPAEASTIVMRRIKAKTNIIEKLLAGELTLFEAGAWFRYLNSEPKSTPNFHWENLPGNDSNEKICRQVITWTEGRMRHQAPASEIAEVLRRLEEELCRHIADNGKVILPAFEQ